LAAAGSM